jgi:hypothetical protein
MTTLVQERVHPVVQLTQLKQLRIEQLQNHLGFIKRLYKFSRCWPLQRRNPNIGDLPENMVRKLEVTGQSQALTCVATNVGPGKAIPSGFPYENSTAYEFSETWMIVLDDEDDRPLLHVSGKEYADRNGNVIGSIEYSPKRSPRFNVFVPGSWMDILDELIDMKEKEDRQEELQKIESEVEYYKYLLRIKS